jgi:hypothetical protein
MAGTTMQSGGRPPIARTGTARPCAGDPASDADGSQLEPRHPKARDLDQLVGRLQGVQHRREPEVEDEVEREHIHTHGNNDIKNGVLANGPKPTGALHSPSRRPRCAA